MNLRDSIDALFGRRRDDDGSGGAEGAWPRRAPSPHAERSLVLYKFDTCPYCRRVEGALARLEVEVERRDVLLERDAREALIERTGRTTVPCLFIDGEPLFESADIVAWLREHARWREAQGDAPTR